MHHVRQPFVSGASKQTNANATLLQMRQHWTFFKIVCVSSASSFLFAAQNPPKASTLFSINFKLHRCPISDCNLLIATLDNNSRVFLLRSGTSL